MTDSAPVFVSRVADRAATATLSLDFDARRKRRQSVTLDDGRAAWIALERLDAPLADGDLLTTDDGLVARVVAAPERLIAVLASGAALARCAYHLGNRHAQVEVVDGGLRTTFDPVMQAMLVQLGAHVTAIEAPFRPEIGAYHHEHDHAHGPGKIHRFVLKP